MSVLLAASSVCVALSACSPPQNGASGVMRGDDGSPVLVFALCEGHLDGATLYRERTTADPGAGATEDVQSVGVREWSLSPRVEGERVLTAPVGVDSPSSPWVLDASSGRSPLAAGTRYVAYAGTEDASGSTAPVDFTLAEVAGLRSGQVLWSTAPEHEVAASADEFLAQAC